MGYVGLVAMVVPEVVMACVPEHDGTKSTVAITPELRTPTSLVKTAVTLTLEDDAATLQGGGSVVPVAVHSSDAGAESHVLEPVYEPA